MKAESRQIPQKLAARLKFFTVSNYISVANFRANDEIPEML